MSVILSKTGTSAEFNIGLHKDCAQVRYSCGLRQILKAAVDAGGRARAGGE